jgi:hypothetical protein
MKETWEREIYFLYFFTLFTRFSFFFLPSFPDLFCGEGGGNDVVPDGSDLFTSQSRIHPTTGGSHPPPDI